MKGYKNKDILEKAYKEFGTLQKTAEYFNVSKKLILNHMKRFGIKRNSKTIPINLKELKRLLKTEIPAYEIAEHFGVSIGTLHKRCEKHGLELDRFHNGKSRKDSGYVLLYKPDHPNADKKGYVPEHRVIAEEKLGRQLKPNEVVHHINHIKDDNRRENLQVMSMKDHKSFHSQQERKTVDLQKVLELQAEGHTIKSIAEKFNVSVDGLRKKLIKAGVYKPFPNGGQRKALNLD